ncbi:hypothetical protein BGZ50_000697, partial [Haplosporangium sp. Z 11]
LEKSRDAPDALRALLHRERQELERESSSGMVMEPDHHGSRFNHDYKEKSLTITTTEITSVEGNNLTSEDSELDEVSLLSTDIFDRPGLLKVRSTVEELRSSMNVDIECREFNFNDGSEKAPLTTTIMDRASVLADIVADAIPPIPQAMIMISTDDDPLEQLFADFNFDDGFENDMDTTASAVISPQPAVTPISIVPALKVVQSEAVVHVADDVVPAHDDVVVLDLANDKDHKTSDQECLDEIIESCLKEYAT